MISWGILFVLLIGIIYVLLILWFYLGIKRVPEFIADKQLSQTPFSILIPFRNEAENLPNLLESIAQLDYPKNLFEILLVDDDSSDKSVQIIQRFTKKYLNLNIQVLENQRQSASPKKDAITSAIRQSKFEWILTTDADCILPKKWLQTYDAYISKNNPKFIAGLVSFQNKKGFLPQFQQLDWMSLVGVTIGSFGWQKPILCSGANLAYNKHAFLEVQGFKGNDQIASGDDVFLLQKMQKAFPKQVSFLNCKEAIVQTKSESTWKDLLQQRIRWASKTSKIPSPYITFIGILVVVTNLLQLSLLLVSPFIEYAGISLGIFFITKLLVDQLLLVKVATILNQKINFLSWFGSSLFYPFFSVSVAFISLFSSYKWKGRKFLK